MSQLNITQLPARLKKLERDRFSVQDDFLAALMAGWKIPPTHTLVTPDETIMDSFHQPMWARLGGIQLNHTDEILRNVVVNREKLENGQAVSHFLDTIHGQKFWANGLLVTEPEFRIWDLEYDPLLDVYHFHIGLSFCQGTGKC